MSRGIIHARVYGIALLLSVLALPAQAHNGQMAIALPVEGIVADGDLSDWPADAVKYPLELTEFGAPPLDEEDFQASFRVGYSELENALYVAVEVRDESVLPTFQGSWNTQDGCELYVYASHRATGKTQAQFVLHGDLRRMEEGVQVVFERGAQTHRYEWRVDLAAISRGKVKLRPDMVLGLDVVVSDKDTDGSYSWIAWGRESNKYANEERVGDLVLVRDSADLGMLAGRVTSAEDGEAYAGLSVEAYRDGQPAGSGLTDAEGMFSMQLLPGEYFLKPGYAVRTTTVKGIQVQRGQETRADLVVAPLSMQGRMSFWIPAQRKAEFAQVYEEQIAPILKRYGLVAAAENTATEADSVFSRLFEVESSNMPGRMWGQLNADPLFVQLSQDLGQRFGTSREDGRIAAVFEPYIVPAVTGRIVIAGPGTIGSGKGSTVGAGSGNRQGVWQNFDVTDGLPSPFVSALHQDRAGTMWIATQEGGICRYDGAEFTSYTKQDGLAGHRVRCMLEDSKGHMWFGTDDGVSRYDGERDGKAWFTTFTVDDGLGADQVRSIMEDRAGNLWFGTNRAGVSRYDGKEFVTYTTGEGLTGNIVRAMLEDRAGNLWFSTAAGKVTRFDGEYFITVSSQDGLPSSNVESIYEDRAGNIWFGSQGGATRFDGERFTTLTADDGLMCDLVMAIYEDEEGYLWFGGRQWWDGKGGVSRYDGEHFVNFTAQDGLISDDVKAILEDGEGHLWFGTNGGISRYDGRQFTTFTVRDGLPANTLGQILEDRQGRLWFTTGVGVVRYDGEEFEHFTVADGLINNNVVALAEDRAGNVWIGTYASGVSRYDGKEFVNFTSADGLHGNSIFSILEDRKGHLWFSSWANGVSRYDGSVFQALGVQDGLPDNNVRAILEDRADNLWFATQSGLCRYDGEHFEVFTTADGLPDDEVQAMLEDSQGNLWFATDEGVARYDGDNFRTFTTQDGLVNQRVWRMLEDQRGHLWFATDGGISRYDGFVFQSMYRRDGLPSNVVHDFHQTADGDVWITTAQGVTRYRSNSAPPDIRIADVIANRRYGAVGDVSLPLSEDPLEFEFRGESYKTRPEQMVYVYRLQGYEEEWRQTRQQRVRYTDLPQGEYVFQVRAVDRDLDYSKVAAGVRVHIRLPYGAWALWGGLGIAVLVALVAIAYAAKRRRDLRRAEQALLEQQRRHLEDQQQALREKEQAQEMLVRSESMAAIGTLVAGAAHELNNPIGAAASLVQTTEEVLEEESPENIVQDREMMVDDLKFARKELGRAKEIVASLLGLSRQSQDYTEEVDLQTVVQDALRVLYNKYKQYEVNIAEDYADGVPVVQGNFAQLGQVALNLVQNAIEAMGDQMGRIEVKTYAENGHAVFECRDSGPGMPEKVQQDIFKPFFTTKAPGEGTGLGLYVCHQIIEKHGGELGVESEIGQGTTFKVKLPLKSA